MEAAIWNYSKGETVFNNLTSDVLIKTLIRYVKKHTVEDEENASFRYAVQSSQGVAANSDEE